MNAVQSRADLRNLLFDFTAELAQYSSVLLPDGASAYNNETNVLYRLDKTLGTTLDVLIDSGLIVKPDDQTTARWVAESVAGSSPYGSVSYMVTGDAVPMTANGWNLLGAGAGTFALSAGDEAVFALNADSSQLTYHGPTRQALVTMTASITNGSTATSIEVHACISRNGDVTPASTTLFRAEGEQAQSIINELKVFTVEREVTLSEGTTLQLALRNATNGDDLGVSFYQCVVSPL